MKSMSELLRDWRLARTNLEKLNKDLPRIVGNECVRVVKQNFELQGYDSGTGVKSWEPRTDATNKAYNKRSGVKGSVYNAASKILLQTKNLYNSIRYIVTGRRVTVGSDVGLVPYGERMNEGGPGKWGKNNTNTPERKYMPDPGEPPNPKMLKNIQKKVRFEQDKAMKKFKR